MSITALFRLAARGSMDERHVVTWEFGSTPCWPAGGGVQVLRVCSSLCLPGEEQHDSLHTGGRRCKCFQDHLPEKQRGGGAPPRIILLLQGLAAVQPLTPVRDHLTQVGVGGGGLSWSCCGSVETGAGKETLAASVRDSQPPPRTARGPTVGSGRHIQAPTCRGSGLPGPPSPPSST